MIRGTPHPDRGVAATVASSRIKRRRATRDEMSTRRRRIKEIVQRDQPMTVRQVYYQAVVHGIVGKAETEYDKIQDLLTDLRRSEEIPYEWIIDEGRRARRPYTVQGIVQALNDTRRSYRRDPWQETPAYVQIWVEKNALIGVLELVTDEYDVPLMSAIGYSSISFLHESGTDLSDIDAEIYIYQLGDLDPSGTQAAEAIEKDLRGFAPLADIHFERIGITPEQIIKFELQAALRPTSARTRAIAGSAIDTAMLLSCKAANCRANSTRFAQPTCASWCAAQSSGICRASAST